MVRVDPAFERVARRLSVVELRAEDASVPATSEGTPGGTVNGRFDPFAADSGLFVDFYTPAGLRRAITRYGLHEKLVEQGLGDWELVVTREDAFRHRMEVVINGGTTRVMDLRLHLSRVAMPGAEESVDVVFVDWLLMQNPRRSFSVDRPRLPGQQHPGTGLGRAVHNLLLILCRRIQREALLSVPEYWHLARIYQSGGYVPLSPSLARDMDDITRAGEKAGLSLCLTAWAVERGCVVLPDGAAYSWHPSELLAPVSSRLEAGVRSGGFLHQPSLARRTLRLDVEALRKSLADQPVEGVQLD